MNETNLEKVLDKLEELCLVLVSTPQSQSKEKCIEIDNRPHLIYQQYISIVCSNVMSTLQKISHLGLTQPALVCRAWRLLLQLLQHAGDAARGTMAGNTGLLGIISRALSLAPASLSDAQLELMSLVADCLHHLLVGPLPVFSPSLDQCCTLLESMCGVLQKLASKDVNASPESVERCTSSLHAALQVLVTCTSAAVLAHPTPKKVFSALVPRLLGPLLLLAFPQSPAEQARAAVLGASPSGSSARSGLLPVGDGKWVFITASKPGVLHVPPALVNATRDLLSSCLMHSAHVTAYAELAAAVAEPLLTSAGETAAAAAGTAAADAAPASADGTATEGDGMVPAAMAAETKLTAAGEMAAANAGTPAAAAAAKVGTPATAAAAAVAARPYQSQLFEALQAILSGPSPSLTASAACALPWMLHAYCKAAAAHRTELAQELSMTAKVLQSSKRSTKAEASGASEMPLAGTEFHFLMMLLSLAGQGLTGNQDAKQPPEERLNKRRRKTATQLSTPVSGPSASQTSLLESSSEIRAARLAAEKAETWAYGVELLLDAARHSGAYQPTKDTGGRQRVYLAQVAQDLVRCTSLTGQGATPSCGSPALEGLLEGQGKGLHVEGAGQHSRKLAVATALSALLDLEHRALQPLMSDVLAIVWEALIDEGGKESAVGREHDEFKVHVCAGVLKRIIAAFAELRALPTLLQHLSRALRGVAQRGTAASRRRLVQLLCGSVFEEALSTAVAKIPPGQRAPLVSLLNDELELWCPVAAVDGPKGAGSALGLTAQPSLSGDAEPAHPDDVLAAMSTIYDVTLKALSVDLTTAVPLAAACERMLTRVLNPALAAVLPQVLRVLEAAASGNGDGNGSDKERKHKKRRRSGIDGTQDLEGKTTGIGSGLLLLRAYAGVLRCHAMCSALHPAISPLFKTQPHTNGNALDTDASGAAEVSGQEADGYFGAASGCSEDTILRLLTALPRALLRTGAAADEQLSELPSFLLASGIFTCGMQHLQVLHQRILHTQYTASTGHELPSESHSLASQTPPSVHELRRLCDVLLHCLPAMEAAAQSQLERQLSAAVTAAGTETQRRSSIQAISTGSGHAHGMASQLLTAVGAADAQCDSSIQIKVFIQSWLALTLTPNVWAALAESEHVRHWLRIAVRFAADPSAAGKHSPEHAQHIHASQPDGPQRHAAAVAQSVLARHSTWASPSIRTALPSVFAELVQSELATLHDVVYGLKPPMDPSARGKGESSTGDVEQSAGVDLALVVKLLGTQTQWMKKRSLPQATDGAAGQGSESLMSIEVCERCCSLFRWLGRTLRFIGANASLIPTCIVSSINAAASLIDLLDHTAASDGAVDGDDVKMRDGGSQSAAAGALELQSSLLACLAEALTVWSSLTMQVMRSTTNELHAWKPKQLKKLLGWLAALHLWLDSAPYASEDSSTESAAAGAFHLQAKTVLEAAGNLTRTVTRCCCLPSCAAATAGVVSEDSAEAREEVLLNHVRKWSSKLESELEEIEDESTDARFAAAAAYAHLLHRVAAGTVGASHQQSLQSKPQEKAARGGIASASQQAQTQQQGAQAKPQDKGLRKGTAGVAQASRGDETQGLGPAVNICGELLSPCIVMLEKVLPHSKPAAGRTRSIVQSLTCSLAACVGTCLGPTLPSTGKGLAPPEGLPLTEAVRTLPSTMHHLWGLYKLHIVRSLNPEDAVRAAVLLEAVCSNLRALNMTDLMDELLDAVCSMLSRHRRPSTEIISVITHTAAASHTVQQQQHGVDAASTLEASLIRSFKSLMHSCDRPQLRHLLRHLIACINGSSSSSGSGEGSDGGSSSRGNSWGALCCLLAAVEGVTGKRALKLLSTLAEPLVGALARLAQPPLQPASQIIESVERCATATLAMRCAESLVARPAIFPLSATVVSELLNSGRLALETHRTWQGRNALLDKDSILAPAALVQAFASLCAAGLRHRPETLSRGMWLVTRGVHVSLMSLLKLSAQVSLCRSSGSRAERLPDFAALERCGLQIARVYNAVASHHRALSSYFPILVADYLTSMTTGTERTLAQVTNNDVPSMSMLGSFLQDKVAASLQEGILSIFSRLSQEERQALHVVLASGQMGERRIALANLKRDYESFYKHEGKV